MREKCTVIRVAKVTALRQLCFHFAVTICSLSVSVALSEHSVTFEFLKFKTRAQRDHLVQPSYQNLEPEKFLGLAQKYALSEISMCDWSATFAKRAMTRLAN